MEEAEDHSRVTIRAHGFLMTYLLRAIHQQQPLLAEHVVRLARAAESALTSSDTATADTLRAASLAVQLAEQAVPGVSLQPGPTRQ